MGAVFALPFPVALFSITMALAAIFWIASGDLRAKLHRALASPVAWGVLALLAWLALATVYSTAPVDDVRAVSGKYAKLLYIPVLISIFHESAWRERALIAFVASLGLVLGISYAKFAGALPEHWLAPGNVVAKTRILHSVLMAILIYVLTSWYLRYPHRRWWCAIGILAALGNLLFLVDGRTGYAVLIALVAVLLFTQWRWRGLAIAAAACVALGTLAYVFAPVFQQRVDQSLQEFTDYRSHGAGATVADSTSVGLRLEHWANTWSLIQERPLLGSGTGSWRQEYRARVADPDAVLLLDAHNEYLMIWAQAGMVGLFLYLVMLATQWRMSLRLTDDDRMLAQGVVAMVLVVGLFNASLLYSHEGKVYVVMAGVAFAGLLKRSRGHTVSGEVSA